jgi:hypothetical protein
VAPQVPEVSQLGSGGNANTTILENEPYPNPAATNDITAKIAGLLAMIVFFSNKLNC